VRPLRTLSGRRLAMVLVAAVAIVIAAAVAAVAARSSTADTPPAKPLADALHDALAAPQPEGVTARVTFTNNLLPSSSLFGNVGSPLMSGASGRLWLTKDGHGRIELQSDSGDVQIVWSPTAVTVYDASSNTVYKLSLPARSNDATQTNTPPTTAQVSDFLAQLAQHVDLSGASPRTVGGRPAYEASAAPKETGSLLDSLRVAWDAEQGVPLSAGIYAKGDAAPALRLAVDSISYGPVSSSDVDIAPPADAKVVDLGTPSAGHDASRPKPVTGLAAVQAGAGFDVVAPDSVAGRARTQVLLLGDRVLLVYGEGPGSIVVVERKADAAQSPGGMLGALPKVDVNGATGHELATQLGTALAWERDGVGFVLVGSVPAATAESAARDVA